MLRTNTSQILYSTDSYVVSLAASPDCKYLISGHIDGSIYRFTMTEAKLERFTIYSGVPYCLKWGLDILVAGDSEIVYVYSEQGEIINKFTYDTKNFKDFTCSSVSNDGKFFVVGNYNLFIVYNFNDIKNIWEEVYN